MYRYTSSTGYEEVYYHRREVLWNTLVKPAYPIENINLVFDLSESVQKIPGFPG